MTMPHIVGVQLKLALVLLYEGEMMLRATLEEMDHRGFYLQLIAPGFQDSNSGAPFQVDGIYYRKDIRPGA